MTVGTGVAPPNHRLTAGCKVLIHRRFDISAGTMRVGNSGGTSMQSREGWEDAKRKAERWDLLIPRSDFDGGSASFYRITFCVGLNPRRRASSFARGFRETLLRQGFGGKADLLRIFFEGGFSFSGEGGGKTSLRSGLSHCVCGPSLLKELLQAYRKHQVFFWGCFYTHVSINARSALEFGAPALQSLG